MKKALRYIFPALGLALTVMFCISANNSAVSSPAPHFYSEPISLFLTGIAMIGFASLLKVNGSHSK
jgi:hypothetical protein